MRPSIEVTVWRNREEFDAEFCMEGTLLGRGHSGTVVLGHNPARGFGAVKVVKPDYASLAAQEAKVVKGLNHPNVCRLLGVMLDPAADSLLLYEYLSGGSLRLEWERRGAVECSRALKLVQQAADAIAYVHAQGFVHRDVKDDNIVFRSQGVDEVVLCDFGLACRVGEHHQVCGTKGWMAPEAAEGKAVPRSDVFSLGVLLYTLLAAARPFTPATGSRGRQGPLVPMVCFHEPCWNEIPIVVVKTLRELTAAAPEDRMDADVLERRLLQLQGEEASATPCEDLEQWVPWSVPGCGPAVAPSEAWVPWAVGPSKVEGGSCDTTAAGEGSVSSVGAIGPIGEESRPVSVITATPPLHRKPSRRSSKEKITDPTAEKHRRGSKDRPRRRRQSGACPRESRTQT
mmetsp:Transcript_56953/g.152092  ORF Transcript_56953/g.152092 Transcript_56953/m.152092 type:complete len:400 (-) Transcript_56953:80-1279(-)